MIYILLAFIGVSNAISELSNHGKLNHWGKWWTVEAWNNKNTWKPKGWWKIYPLIIFTDAFHFFKTLWVLSMCFSIYLGGMDWWLAFIIYSCWFQVAYSLIPYFRLK